MEAMAAPICRVLQLKYEAAMRDIDIKVVVVAKGNVDSSGRLVSVDRGVSSVVTTDCAAGPRVVAVSDIHELFDTVIVAPKGQCVRRSTPGSKRPEGAVLRLGVRQARSEAKGPALPRDEHRRSSDELPMLAGCRIDDACRVTCACLTLQVAHTWLPTDGRCRTRSACMCWAW